MKKLILGLSLAMSALTLTDNVTYFSEQLKSSDVSAYHYRVIFKPQVIIPDIDTKINLTDLLKTQ